MSWRGRISSDPRTCPIGETPFTITPTRPSFSLATGSTPAWTVTSRRSSLPRTSRTCTTKSARKMSWRKNLRRLAPNAARRLSPTSTTPSTCTFGWHHQIMYTTLLRGFIHLLLMCPTNKHVITFWMKTNARNLPQNFESFRDPMRNNIFFRDQLWNSSIFQEFSIYLSLLFFLIFSTFL